MGLTQDILAKYVQNCLKMSLATHFHGIRRPPVGPFSSFYASNTSYSVSNTSRSTVPVMKMKI